jgi:NAD(P)H-flavin reductase
MGEAVDCWISVPFANWSPGPRSKRRGLQVRQDKRGQDSSCRWRLERVLGIIMRAMLGLDQPVLAVAKVLSVRPLGERACLVRASASRPLEFLPGQYVALQRIGEGKQRHYFTIASPPSLNTPSEFELCLSRGSSEFVDGVAPGEVFQLVGPLGEVIRPRDEATCALLVATGSGTGLLRSGVLHRLWGQRRMVAIVGQRTEGDLLFDHEFSQVSGLEYRPVLSRPRSDWPGLRGHVQDALEAVLRGGLVGPTDAVVCGQKSMVDDVVQRLKRAGFSDRAIFAQGY